MMTVAPQSPRLVARYGAPRVVSAGMGCVALGLTLLGLFARVDSSYVRILPMFLVLPLGMALTISPMTASIMSAVPLGRAGAGSAMNDTTRELGGALGVAVLGSVLASRFASQMGGAVTGLSADAARVARGGLAGGLSAAREVGGEAGVKLADAARASFVSGLHVAALVAAVAAVAASLTVGRLLPRTAQVPQPERVVVPDLALEPAAE